MQDDNHTTLSALQPRPELLRGRLGQLTVKVTDTEGGALCEFDVRALDNRVLRFALAQSTDAEGNVDSAGLIYWLVSFGIADLRGLEEAPAFETCRVLGKDYQRISFDWLDRLDPELFKRLSKQVQDLNGMSRKERLRLDFT